MAERKKIVKNRNELAAMLTSIESGLSHIKVGDAREMLKILVGLEATSILAHKKSIVMMLRKEAVILAAKTKKARK